MALIYGVVAQYEITAADTYEDAYTVPANNRFVGQIIVANTSTTNNRTFRLAVRANGDVIAAKHFLAYDIVLTPGEIAVFGGLTLSDTDVVTVRSDNSSTTIGDGVIVHLYGEIDDNV